MIEDLMNKINEVITEEGDQRSQDGNPKNETHINVGDITGDNNTVIIGDHPRRRREDREGGDDSHGRRASDHALHQELRSLRQQVHHLKQLVTDLYERCNLNTRKRPKCPAAACLTSNGSTGANQVNVSNHRSPASTIRKIAESLGMRGFRSHQPIPTHINPGISFLLAPNTGEAPRVTS